MNRRCVLVGPPLCGKRTLLTAFARRLNLRIGIREINDRSLATVVHYTTLRSGSDVIDAGAEAIFGWRADEVKGRHFSFLFMEGDRDRVVELYDLQEFQFYVSTLQDPATEGIRKCIAKYETT